MCIRDSPFPRAARACRCCPAQPNTQRAAPAAGPGWKVAADSGALHRGGKAPDLQNPDGSHRSASCTDPKAASLFCFAFALPAVARSFRLAAGRVGARSCCSLRRAASAHTKRQETSRRPRLVLGFVVRTEEAPEAGRRRLRWRGSGGKEAREQSPGWFGIGERGQPPARLRAGVRSPAPPPGEVPARQRWPESSASEPSCPLAPWPWSMSTTST